jgi:hypothetical protein
VELAAPFNPNDAPVKIFQDNTLVLWNINSSKLDDSYTTGSSIMHREKTRTGRASKRKNGKGKRDLLSLLTMRKGLPLA